ncbi:MAG: hypothetical protein AABY07_06390, partial [Nanoarchaeota archaeon]
MKILSKNNNEDVIRDLSREKSEPEFILSKRLNALQDFNKLQMPNFKYGLNIRLNYDFDLDNLELNSSNSSISLSDNKEVIFTTFDALD